MTDNRGRSSSVSPAMCINMAWIARLTPLEVTRHCELQRESRVLLGTAISRLGLSARACHRVLKLARTSADLAGEPRIRRIDVAEAVHLRALDKPCG